MRRVPTFLRVIVSFVLRVDASRAADGVLTGQIEDVATGEAAVIRGVTDLLAFCGRRAESASSRPNGGETHV